MSFKSTTFDKKDNIFYIFCYKKARTRIFPPVRFAIYLTIP